MAKLTREQVSQLSDVELNRGVIWCYPPDGKFWSDPDTGTNYAWDEFIGLEQLHYLTDYNLTMPLAYKHDIFSGPFNQDNLWFAHDNKCQGFSAYNEQPLRAICEVLLMIAMERE